MKSQVSFTDAMIGLCSTMVYEMISGDKKNLHL